MAFLERILQFPLYQIPAVFLVLVISFTLHEFAHAYSALRFGDPTAKNQGRVTLNPLVHLDVIGTLLMFVAGFGWAKPVPVRRDYFKNPRLMGIVVSILGPLSNLMIALAGILLLYIFNYLGIFSQMSPGVFVAVTDFFNLLISINLLLCVFNLLPLPPLDGYRMINDMVPQGVRARMSQYEQWGIFVFLLLIFFPQLRNLILTPVFSLINILFSFLNMLISSVFGYDIY